VLDDIEIDKPHILLESGVWRGQNKMVSTALNNHVTNTYRPLHCRSKFTFTQGFTTMTNIMFGLLPSTAFRPYNWKYTTATDVQFRILWYS